MDKYKKQKIKSNPTQIAKHLNSKSNQLASTLKTNQLQILIRFHNQNRIEKESKLNNKIKIYQKPLRMLLKILFLKSLKNKPSKK